MVTIFTIGINLKKNSVYCPHSILVFSVTPQRAVTLSLTAANGLSLCTVWIGTVCKYCWNRLHASKVQNTDKCLNVTLKLCAIWPDREHAYFHNHLPQWLCIHSDTGAKPPAVCWAAPSIRVTAVAVLHCGGSRPATLVHVMDTFWTDWATLWQITGRFWIIIKKNLLKVMPKGKGKGCPT